MSADAPAVRPPVTAEALVAWYEVLRRRSVNGSGGSGGLGLAVLRREGLAAWIAAWATVPAPDPVAVPLLPDATPRWADDRQVEVVRLLAGMALPHLERRMSP